MSKPIIEVNNISKKYKIGINQPYYSLRDTLMNVIKSPAKYVLPQSLKRKEKSISNEFWALKNINFKVVQGEAIGIIGLNGAGKSTLLKILTRVTPPTSGEAILRGRVASLLEVGTGFHPELTGRENIYLNGAILGMKRWEINNKFNDIVEFAETERFLDMPMKHYSSGMYTRLAFAVAAHLEPEILLVDEVLAVGDVNFQKKCIGKMNEATKKEGRTILFVSHNMGAVQNLCSRCVLLEKGQIKTEGETSKVVAEYLKINVGTSKISLSSRKDRKGSGRLKVTNIYLKDKDGKDVTFFKCGEDAQIWVEYELIDKNIKEVDFGVDIGVFDEDKSLALLSNKIFNRKVSTKINPIKIHLNKIPLNEGKYQITVLFQDQTGDIVDWVQRAGVLDVSFGDYYKTGRLPLESNGCLLLNYWIENF